MKKIVFVILIGLLAITCDKIDNKKGTVAFGANYHVIDCITTVTVFIDDEKLGTLTSYVDRINDCQQAGTLTKDLSVGKHSYKVEIRPLAGTGTTKDLTGTIQMDENDCIIVFIDYYTIDF